MVYGEYVQQPAVAYTKLLASFLPKNLETTYLVNSGTEAIEGALKLARRYTGRSELIAAHNAYHGNTMGSLSVTGYEVRKSAFRPFIPDVSFIQFNSEVDLGKITKKTAAVILETIQGGAGFILPKKDYLKEVQTTQQTLWGPRSGPQIVCCQVWLPLGSHFVCIVYTLYIVRYISVYFCIFAIFYPSTG